METQTNNINNSNNFDNALPLINSFTFYTNEEKDYFSNFKHIIYNIENIDYSKDSLFEKQKNEKNSILYINYLYLELKRTNLEIIRLENILENNINQNIEKISESTFAKAKKILNSFPNQIIRDINISWGNDGEIIFSFKKGNNNLLLSITNDGLIDVLFVDALNYQSFVGIEEIKLRYYIDKFYDNWKNIR